MSNGIVTEQKNKPALDEQTFGKLLEAAHVLQEHNRKMRELEERMDLHNERLREQEAVDQAAVAQPRQAQSHEVSRPGDYTLTLAEIVEAQRQIQVRHLTADHAMAVVAERVARITSASGAAVGILDGKIVRYRAGTGPSALPAGTEVPLSAAVCAASVRTGQVIRSEDVNTEVLFDPEPCRQRGILSLLAVPIYHDGDIVGALELYFDRIHGYAEQDIHTCQLLAGLVTEALGRDAESSLKKTVAEERSTMIAAIEKLQPQLAALVEDASSANRGSNVAVKSPAEQITCWKCGSKRAEEEQFCGKCGAASADGLEADASQILGQAIRDNSAAAPANGSSASQPAMHAAAEDLQEQQKPVVAPEKIWSDFEPFSPSPAHAEADRRVASRSLARDNGEAMTKALASPVKPQVDEEEQAEHERGSGEARPAPAKPQADDLVWSSASKARNFLESLTGARKPNALARFWSSRRGDFYLAIAVILVVVVIRWGMWSNHSVGATSHGTAVSSGANHRAPQPASNPDLSTLDKLLIGLGLAEAPEPPQAKGNPDTQVWVDLHTALYYCPGADLYGKTAKGKYTSQRDAQLDQFEPANRKPCE